VGVLIALLVSGCGAAWPTVTGLADPAFAAGRLGARTIEVLPIDVQLWSHDAAVDPAELAAAFDAMAASAVDGELARHGYQVVAHVDWDGSEADGVGRRQAMSADQVARTAEALSSFGSAQAREPAGLLVPYLPVRLGVASGADATLYVGGWAYAGTPPPSRGKQIAKGVLIGLAVVAVVVIVVASLKGGGNGLGGVAGGAARAAGGAVRVAGRVAGAAGRVATGLARATLEQPELVLRTADSALRMADAFGRMDSHLDVVGERPDFYAQPGVPHRGRSALLLELTLIDNHSGRALWHARQRFRADPTRPDQVARALRSLLAVLPAAA
jgi:hypothetical protein